MKTTVVFAVVVAALAISARAITITDINVTGHDNPSGSNVTIVAIITGATAGAFINCEVKSTNDLVRQSLLPSERTGVDTWINASWIPYFTGDFVVTVNAYDFDGAYQEATLSTTVTVTRTISGVMNSVKVASSTNYNANGPWTNIAANVIFNNIGWVMDPSGVAYVGCNLQNANPTGAPDMTEEQWDIAYNDTAAYKPVGTPFRFDMNLHARPTSIMGFGEIKRFIWTPVSTAASNGPGRLVLDVTSCSPWRNNYSANFQASVGFAPIFMADTNQAAEMEGILMCTTAHYMDVGPTNNSTSSRVGLRVNGHSNTTSYLKTFIPDTKLAQFGVTNVDMATNVLMGYVTHFMADGASEEDTAAVPPTFIRISGGTNIVYDYNGDGVGDLGYEAWFTFTFHSPVAAEMGPVGETPDSGFNWVAGDFDGDRISDPAMYLAYLGTWQILLSSAGYTPVPITNFGGTGWVSTAGDFDGDLKADPAIYCAASNTMTVQLSGSGYAQASVTDLGGSGYVPITGDFDGDGKADPAVYRESSGTFAVKLSASGYGLATVAGFGGAGYTQVDGDFDGDLKADPAIYHAANGNWIFKLSSENYLIYELSDFGSTNYVPVSGDFDGDGKADPAMYRNSNGLWAFALSSANYLIYTLSGLGDTNSADVYGDFDGDAKADPAVVNTIAGVLSVKLSSAGYMTVTLPLAPQ
ncbi:MAG: hypothetical protein KKG09_08745 [Verrucomicrobia bacterium]|nr:hypothetical protein [Verrucomicrobiota bacterium]MBU4246946.1 hypothetical protein [Verrucomicrobiota bacterium]MBU4291346.1 hypothetical protein [Verrucomicrobiota bacterium]MBU4498077.1 hypothetical protein [Verrucomicrobiota bacterium]MCG2680048.1 hypothetical protein [Kiritimatiellia bacterium]